MLTTRGSPVNDMSGDSQRSGTMNKNVKVDAFALMALRFAIVSSSLVARKNIWICSSEDWILRAWFSIPIFLTRSSRTLK